MSRCSRRPPVHDTTEPGDAVPSFDPTYWDERYRESPTVWGRAPNRFVEQELADLPAGRALDLACGEGRNAIWLAGRGWRVDAVDFSSVALAKGAAQSSHGISWIHADATTYSAEARYDLAVICYLQLPAPQRRAAVRAAATALAPGGTLFVVGHDSRNLTDGTGGPQDPAVLFTASDVVADLDGFGLQVERAGEALRPVDGADRAAIDALVRAVRPTAP